MVTEVLPGLSFPIGATALHHGVNFSIASREAIAIELLLFDHPDAPQPSRVMRLDPKQNKTAYYWHVFVPGIGEGQVYAYRAYGDYAPEKGLRFDGSKVLLDPYARAIVGWKNYSRVAASRYGYDNCAEALRGVVVAPSAFVVDGMVSGEYDWEGDRPLSIPLSRTIIYEMHLAGLTRNPNSGVSPEKRGTYAGVIEKIPYLKSLGITAVELLPVHEFDENDARPGLENYWGYSTIGFFSPHRAYSSDKSTLGPVKEFRDMVKALHRAGIEVILDVVFNHTAEGNENGPTLSYRGLWNDAYYMLEPNLALYSNYSGCGNTVDANNPITRNLILDSLRYWVSEMHVDGFRFDLASALARDSKGQPMQDPPLLWAVEADPMLANAKLIAEAWDAAGLYQVGAFIGDRFAEWNGPYRDDIRRFVKGDTNTVVAATARLQGSPDIYWQKERNINRSVNFVTCHDGFTMNDLVSYDQKHNEANGEENRDGSNDNYSWNCGLEGATDNPAIEALRLRQIKNFYTLLFLSQGTTMILMGDEVRRSQQGNNNAYCQNNELSWFDWSALETQTDLLRFVRKLIHLAQSLTLLQRERRLETDPTSPRLNLIWHGTRLNQPDWSANSHTIAFTLRDAEVGEALHVLINAYWEPLTFQLPELGDGKLWYRIIDTAQTSPDDFCELEAAPVIKETEYWMEARSTVILQRR
jgi:glycogen operon protein